MNVFIQIVFVILNFIIYFSMYLTDFNRAQFCERWWCRCAHSGVGRHLWLFISPFSFPLLLSLPVLSYLFTPFIHSCMLVCSGNRAKLFGSKISAQRWLSVAIYIYYIYYFSYFKQKIGSILKIPKLCLFYLIWSLFHC